MFHLLAHLLSPFWQIVVSLSKIGQTEEHKKSKSTVPGARPDELPCSTDMQEKAKARLRELAPPRPEVPRRRDSRNLAFVSSCMSVCKMESIRAVYYTALRPRSMANIRPRHKRRLLSHRVRGSKEREGRTTELRQMFPSSTQKRPGPISDWST